MKSKHDWRTFWLLLIVAGAGAGQLQFRDPDSDYDTVDPCPDNKPFCEDDEAPDYPGNNQLENTLLLTRSNFFSDQNNLRVGASDEGESRACESRKYIVYPRKARNIDGKYRYVVNEKSYVQAVEIEQCIGEGKPCRVDSDAPNPNSTVCRQKYTPYKMSSFDSNGRQYQDYFSLPSACVCYSHRNLGLRSSFFRNEGPELPICADVDAGRSAPPADSRPSSQPIIFESDRSLSKVIFKDRKKRQARPQTCDGTRDSGTYCESSSDYPSNIVLNAIKSSRVSQSLLNKLLRPMCVERRSIFVRVGFNLNEKPLCDGSRKVIFPKKALNLANVWKYVVNVGNYTQSIEIEECDKSRLDNPNEVSVEKKNYGSCEYGDSIGKNPEFTRCRQIYSIHKLVSLSNTGTIELDSFKLPIACDCFLREDYDVDFAL